MGLIGLGIGIFLLSIMSIRWVTKDLPRNEENTEYWKKTNKLDKTL